MWHKRNNLIFGFSQHTDLTTHRPHNTQTSQHTDTRTPKILKRKALKLCKLQHCRLGRAMKRCKSQHFMLGWALKRCKFSTLSLTGRLTLSLGAQQRTSAQKQPIRPPAGPRERQRAIARSPNPQPHCSNLSEHPRRCERQRAIARSAQVGGQTFAAMLM